MEPLGILGILAACIGVVVAAIGVVLAPVTWPYPGTIAALVGGLLLVVASVVLLRGSPTRA